MRKIVNMFRFASTYVRLVRDTSRLDLVFALADSLVDPKVKSPALVEMLAKPGVSEYLADPWPPLQADLASLRAMPEGSLGRAFAAFLDQRGLDPTGVYHSDLERDGTEVQRYKLHMERTHDLWHTVLGYDTDVAGELAVQAVYVAQLGSGLGAVILSGGLLNTILFKPKELELRMEAIVHGWRLGKSLRPLFGADWVSMLGWPLTRVREHFGMKPGDVFVPTPVVAAAMAA